MVDRAGFGWKKGVSGRAMWVSSEPSLEEVTELARCYLEVAELPKDEVKGETDEWLAKGLVVRSLGWRVLVEVAVRKFRLCAGLKGNVVTYNME